MKARIDCRGPEQSNLMMKDALGVQINNYQNHTLIDIC